MLPWAHISNIAARQGRFPDLLMGQTFVQAIGPWPLVRSWCEAGNPVVNVEKGYGSGTFQDLYPWTDGKLYTAAFGAGTEASAWAAGAKLLVEIPYNQAGADTSTSQPTKLAANKRVLLNLDQIDAPCFAGYSTGTQDASQHATERGYSITTTHNAESTPFTMMVAYKTISGEQTYIIQDTAATPTAYYYIDMPSLRHFQSWEAEVETIIGNDIPRLYQSWSINDGLGLVTNVTRRMGHSGTFRDHNLYTTASTTYNLNVMGPYLPMRGRLYALLIATGSLAAPTMLWGGIPRNLSRTYTKDIATDKPDVSYPYTYATIPMNMTTMRADIPIRLIGKPNTAYEAQWQSGGYVTVGTTGSDGWLQGSIPSQSIGNGTVDVREVGGSTPVSIANVAIGYVIYAFGESDPDGRNDNVTTSFPTNYLRLQRAAWTTASNEWWKLFCQKIYDTYGCPVSVTKCTAGSTAFLNGATAHSWNVDNTATAPDQASLGRSRALGMQADFLLPNIWLFEIGKNDALFGTSGANFKTAFRALLSDYRTNLNNSSIKFDVVSIGPNNGVTAANSLAIRIAIQELATDYPDEFSLLGSFAHLTTTESGGVHLKTEAEKLVAANVAFRHKHGAGAAPKYLSGSKAGANITLTFTGGVSPLTISSSSDTAGWAVTDGSGSATVSSVAVSGLTVTLTCNRTLTGTATVTWCSGESGAGTTLLDSDPSRSCPPYPFSATI